MSIYLNSRPPYSLAIRSDDGCKGAQRMNKAVGAGVATSPTEVKDAKKRYSAGVL